MPPHETKQVRGWEVDRFRIKRRQRRRQAQKIRKVRTSHEARRARKAICLPQRNRAVVNWVADVSVVSMREVR